MSIHQSRILKLWRNIEAFNIPDMPKPETTPSQVLQLVRPGNTLSWHKKIFKDHESGKKWRNEVLLPNKLRN
jgi:hypothetical protein